MSEAKFTKGEWEVDDSCVFSNEYLVCDVFISGNKNDAHLIAAAPEMYEAINHVLEMQLRGFIVLGNEATEKMQKALAKARGE